MQSREVGTLKSKHLLSGLLGVLLLGLLVALGGCGATGQQTKVTVWSTGTNEMTAEAEAVEEAIQSMEQSPDIETPATAKTDLLAAVSDAASPPLAYLANVVRIEAGEETKTLEVVGFEIDLCRAVSKKIGLELHVVQVSWPNLIPSLDTGPYDIIVSAMMTGPEEPDELLATDPYLAADLAICTTTRQTLADEEDLKGKRVGVQIGTFAESTVETIDDVGEIRTYAHLPGAFQDLAAGKLDAVVAQEFPSRWILDNGPGYGDSLSLSGKIETGEGYAFWCGKNQKELLAAMNTALAELREDGIYQQILDKWGLIGN
jgi:ABC-type amino acid transport substrate-binding protein